MRDTGVGVPEQAKAKLFEAFSQVRAADARRDGGVGLGLAISSSIMADLGGRLTAHNAETGGAVAACHLAGSIQEF